MVNVYAKYGPIKAETSALKHRALLILIVNTTYFSCLNIEIENKGNNKITELRTISQRESQNCI
jgi:hypothetical protein